MIGSIEEHVPIAERSASQRRKEDRMLAVWSLLGLMALTWAAAVWASFQGEGTDEVLETRFGSTAGRHLKAA